MSGRRGSAGFPVDEDGQGLVEYALILGTIAIAVIIAMVFMRDNLLSLFSDISNTVGQYPGN